MVIYGDLFFSDWWFGTFCIFPYMWNNDPNIYVYLSDWWFMVINGD